MECKCNCRWVSLKIQAELIDTLWNVNDIFAGEKALKSLELIDTLWNVNIFFSPPEYYSPAELIDTLWNVNF